MPSLGDHDLIQRCLAGDGSAFTQLVDRYARMVGTVIWRAIRDEAGVEDVVQETFLRAFRALPYFNGRAKLSTWLCTIAHHAAIDYLRRVQRLGEEPMPIDEEGGAFAVTSPLVVTQTPEDLAASEELSEHLRKELAALPNSLRLPLMYVTIEGLDYATVASMLQMPIGSVKGNVFRAKQRLKERLAVRLRARVREERP